MIHLLKIINESNKNNLLTLKENNIVLTHSTNVKIEKNNYLNYWNDIIQKEFEKLFPNDIMEKFNYP